MIKIIFTTLMAATAPTLAQAQTLEYPDGPTSKINPAEIADAAKYNQQKQLSLSRLENTIESLTDSNEIKQELFDGIESILTTSSRTDLLLDHTLKAGMILVKAIDQTSINRGLQHTPEGTIDQQIRILKKAITLAKAEYVPEFIYQNGIRMENEAKANPKLLAFGLKLNEFVLEVSNGLLNAQSAYTMIRWSLGALQTYIEKDKMFGNLHRNTRKNMAEVLLAKDKRTNQPIFPDIVQKETAPTDFECLEKISRLKLYSQRWIKEIKATEEANAKALKE